MFCRSWGPLKMKSVKLVVSFMGFIGTFFLGKEKQVYCLLFVNITASASFSKIPTLINTKDMKH